MESWRNSRFATFVARRDTAELLPMLAVSWSYVAMCFPRSVLAFPCLALLLTASAQADQVLCHYTYGGETQTVTALPVSSPYAVKAIQVGSYFKFRVVFQDSPADIASVKIYTYADRDEGPALIHQDTYPYPPANRQAAPYGFSGLHLVYETMRDGELQYWCEIAQTNESSGRGAS
jgi:hypothetical protein